MREFVIQALQEEDSEVKERASDISEWFALYLQLKYVRGA